ncbi:hypothetical protein HLB23_28525 [Nocardia uniformis]|uniref:Uncharacterized protein n=1 Tax=Nocardia uniformis TaxID=53432 RepID=A0A849C4Y0_9NOCA|nr:hypothetical protein [Nocardia uniformis]NNH73754.1 hypothetical protein [Nocardia uniformis]
MISAAVTLVAVGPSGIEPLANAQEPISAESAVEQAIRQHVDARNAGDVVTLRNTACGAMAEDFRDFGPLVDLAIWWQGPGQGRQIQVERFATIDVTDQTAVADTEVRISTMAGLQDVSFMLEHSADGWRVCSTDRPIL